MGQLAFGFDFLGEPSVLVDDASGRIVYAPGIVPRALADAWFAALHETIEWRSEKRPMYDRVVDVPRLTAYYRGVEGWPEPLAQARSYAESFSGVSFNSVGLNLYRDGRDSVAMHNDHTEELAPRSAVALISLGATRKMHVQSKGRPRRTFDVALEPGSIFLMAGAAQHHWEHGIPKTREAVGPRISLAFRQRLDAGEAR